MGFVRTMSDILNTFLVIIVIFGFLFVLKNDWGTGFTLIMIAGIIIFFKTWLEKNY